MELVDQTNRLVKLSTDPRRIISLVPSHTELLIRLGLEDLVVGVSKFCVHPSDLRSRKTVVGGTKTIKIDTIKSLQPDLIICNKEENTKAIVAACEDIAPVYVSDIISLESNLEFIRAVGILTAAEKIAEAIITTIGRKQNDFKAFMLDKKRQRVAYFIWRKPWMVAGAATFINELLKLNNFDNAFDHIDRYPEVDLSELSDQELDLILLSSEPYPFKEEHEKELKKYSAAKILQVDGEAFSWHGSYLLKAFDYFKTLH